MKKLIVVLILIFFAVFMFLVIGQGRYFLNSSAANAPSDSIKQQENSHLTDEKEPVTPTSTLSLPIESVGDANSDIKLETGTYQGQVDSSFIEISISGVPEEVATKIFMLSDELKDDFEDMKLNANEIIQFQYYIDENEQNVIVEIENLNRGRYES